LKPDSTLWKREPHTEGKHLVLRAYLDAWFPIMGRWNGRILFIDGFAGPGQYEGGEDGSPIIALRSLIEHHAKTAIRAEVGFIFIEQRADRAAHLRALVDDLQPDLPPMVRVAVIQGSFDRSLAQSLDALDEQRKKLAPALVMIDPFGVSGTPMEVVARILENPRCEVYVSFMYESMNRFITTPEFADNLDELFGTAEWRKAVDLEGEERRHYLYSLYANQLRAAGAKHVLHFDLYQGNRLVYGIFFGTQHETGCDRMKQAIWKVAPGGSYEFRGSKSDQLVLGVDQPNYQPLRNQLMEEFGARGWVGIAEVLRFVASDATEYHTGQVKRPVLKPLEGDGRVVVDESSRKRKGFYPDGCRLRFIPSEPHEDAGGAGPAQR
jgi:three-Cys-motif partner protein